MKPAAREGASKLKLDGRSLRLSNLDKVLWPAAGVTKGDLIAFYLEVAPAILPHLERRPVTLRRYPDGVEGLHWYQLECRGQPDWLTTCELRGRGGVFRVCLLGDRPSLVWAANLATIEFHPLLARAAAAGEPTSVVFDLDPGPALDIVDCCDVALRLREVLAGLGLASFAKTSGSVGLHVFVPLNVPHTYAETRGFARAVAAHLVAEHPDGVTDKQKRALRTGKILVDWLQNDPMRSTVAPYSLRATPWPSVSTPVAWDEVEAARAARRPE
ncbi:MAG: non-homologous end-joining DNA ligase, partial [Actinomycetota bacterium]|nr:non-homologous end-joining DNA ligase [Actinomycetota bacterium]